MNLFKQNFEAVIFDMDGVIADTNPYHKKAWIKFCKKYNLEISDDILKNHIYGRSNKEIFNFLFDSELSSERLSSFIDEKERIFREIYKGNVKPVKGLMGLLQKLKQSKIKIGLASLATKENMDFVFNELNIKSFFDVIVDPDEIKKSKPDPEIYFKAADLMNIDPGKCIVFEDSIPGVQAGKAAGMQVIGITTSFSKEVLNCEFAVNDFDELFIE